MMISFQCQPENISSKDTGLVLQPAETGAKWRHVPLWERLRLKCNRDTIPDINNNNNNNNNNNKNGVQ